MGGEIYQQIVYYVGALWRRRWLAVGVAVVVALAGWSVVASLPNSYNASARVYVDTTTVLRPLLRGMTVDSDTRQQVEVMRQSLMTRPNLEKVARMTDLDLRATTPKEREQLIERLRANTSISMNRSNIFEVAYTGGEPGTAKAVVDALTTIFVEQNIGQDRADFAKAEDFLQNQISDVEEKLTEIESEIDKKEAELANLIPGPEDDYSAKVTELSNRIEALQEDLAAARTRRDTLESELADTAEQLSGGQTGPSQIEQTIAQLQDKLAQLRLQYTDQHPDVVVAERRLEQLRQQLAEQGTGGSGNRQSASGSGSSNPVYSQLQVSLVEERSQIQILERRLSAAQEQLATLQSRRSEVRAVEDRLKDLETERDILNDRLIKLRERLQSAVLSSESQAQGDSVSFRMIEPPVRPREPSGPNRALFASAVLVVAIGAGVGAAWFIALLKTSYGSVERLKRDFPIPVVGQISVVDNKRRALMRKLDRFAFAGATSSLFALYAGVMLIERQIGLHTFLTQRVNAAPLVNLLESLAGLV
jgi:polysaccharide chain length determinant protein (PEP-CTERM system associated)